MSSTSQRSTTLRDGLRLIPGGTATWACAPGYPPSTIFPFTPPERFGTRNLYEFQVLLYRPLYWFGKDGQPTVDPERSLAEMPEWSADSRTVTVTLKPWSWSNGEPICADNVMFWVNMMAVKGARFGEYVPGYFPDNLTSYEKISDRSVRFTFDKKYSQRWVLMNQLSTITPLPRAWDRTATGPADASSDVTQIPAVYDYLMAENGVVVQEDNSHRTTWPDSPVWSVVSGPWRLRSYTLDGIVTFVPNRRYSGPDKAHLDEFRQVPMFSDEEQWERLRSGPEGPRAIQVGYLPYGFSEVATDDPTVGGANPLERYRLVPQVAFSVRYMCLNFNNPTVAGRIFEQTYFRQALQRTLDQESAIRDIYQGYAYRTNGPVPMLPANDLVSPAQRGNPLPFDVDSARQRLSDNGWDVSTTPAVCVRPGSGLGEAGPGISAGDKLSFSLRYAQGRPALTRVMEALRDDAAKAGIELRLEEVYASVLVAEDAPCAPGPDTPCLWEITCWNGGWVYHHPTGEILFRTNAGGNFGHWSDARADELIERTVTSDDPEVLYEYQDYIAEQAPVIWTPNFPLRVFEVADTLHGFEPVNPFGMINPEDWYYTAT